MENTNEVKDIFLVKDFKIDITTKENTVETSYESFSIQSGDFILLQGKNGSGKSTLFKYIVKDSEVNNYAKIKSGTLEYIEGDETINVAEADEEKTAFLRRHIVDIRQMEDENSLDARESGYNVLLYPSLVYLEEEIKDKAERLKKVSELKKLVDDFFTGYKLPDGNLFSLAKILNIDSKATFSRKKFKSYSGGQQKMLHLSAGIIKCLICNINLMVVDEPVNNLDGKNKYYLNQLFKALREKPDLAIIMISHCRVFDGITKIINIDGSKNIGYKAQIITSTDASDVERNLFSPHSECVEKCDYSGTK